MVKVDGVMTTRRPQKRPKTKKEPKNNKNNTNIKIDVQGGWSDDHPPTPQTPKIPKTTEQQGNKAMEEIQGKKRRKGKEIGGD